MTVDWTPLRDAMSAYRRDSTALPIWWRDDDAVSVTPELERLSNLSADLGLPVHLATIAARLTEPQVSAVVKT